MVAPPQRVKATRGGGAGGGPSRGAQGAMAD
jgi:hypothetical protein